MDNYPYPLVTMICIHFDIWIYQMAFFFQIHFGFCSHKVETIVFFTEIDMVEDLKEKCICNVNYVYVVYIKTMAL